MAVAAGGILSIFVAATLFFFGGCPAATAVSE